VENISDNNLMIDADPTQLHQMIINLATNAKHAMDSGVGTMTVSIEATRFDNSIQKRSPGLTPGDYAHITVSDTGAGISEAHLNRIFEPYFTTREKGLGTGLGLSIVHGIVKSHNGYIEAESQVGKGSTFHVYFPLIRGEKPQPGDLNKTAFPGGDASSWLTTNCPLLKWNSKAWQVWAIESLPAPAAWKRCRRLRHNPEKSTW
jgi:K+-sensing histidine kinase KdpD